MHSEPAGVAALAGSFLTVFALDQLSEGFGSDARPIL
jgi:hypothetical protein